MTFWPKVVNNNCISTLDNSLKLKLLENKKVFILETATNQKLYSVRYALKNLMFLQFPLNLLLNQTCTITKNTKQDLITAIMNLDILFNTREIYETMDAIYFIIKENQENILEIVLKDGSCLEIDSDFEFLKWYREEEYVYCIKKLPWTLHGVEIKNIISKGLDMYIQYSKSLNQTVEQKDISLKSGIKKEVVIQDLAVFTLYLDSRITVMFDDRTIVKTSMAGVTFHVLSKNGDEIILGQTPVGFERYVSIVKQFIEWNRNGCPVSKSVDVMGRLNRSKEFLKQIL
jgi:hypothetical protein